MTRLAKVVCRATFTGVGLMIGLFLSGVSAASCDSCPPAAPLLFGIYVPETGEPAENDYQVEIAVDVTVTETFTRFGGKYMVRYRGEVAK